MDSGARDMLYRKKASDQRGAPPCQRHIVHRAPRARVSERPARGRDHSVRRDRPGGPCPADGRVRFDSARPGSGLRRPRRPDRAGAVAGATLPVIGVAFTAEPQGAGFMIDYSNPTLADTIAALRRANGRLLVGVDRVWHHALPPPGGARQPVRPHPQRIRGDGRVGAPRQRVGGRAGPLPADQQPRTTPGWPSERITRLVRGWPHVPTLSPIRRLVPGRTPNTGADCDGVAVGTGCLPGHAIVDDDARTVNARRRAATRSRRGFRIRRSDHGTTEGRASGHALTGDTLMDMTTLYLIRHCETRMIAGLEPEHPRNRLGAVGARARASASPLDPSARRSDHAHPHEPRAAGAADRHPPQPGAGRSGVPGDGPATPTTCVMTGVG